jgi:folylpolyglutamate synthase/dihydropteroate synthase
MGKRMKDMKQTTSQGDVIAPGKQRSYSEIIEFLDAHWSTPTNLTTVTKLDQALGSPSKKVDAVLVSGTNGKSLTMHFATCLLKEEGISIGALYSPHILTYNERLILNGEVIPNKAFTEIANEVINAAETENLKPHTAELLLAMALVYFAHNNVEVALLEVGEDYADMFKICSPKILAITRITPDNVTTTQEKIEKTLENVTPGLWTVSADQSKINLQIMLDIVTGKGGEWAMPIRKLAPLNYPFEQLHGRCAALAERIAQLYVGKFIAKDAVVGTGSLLVKPAAQRGRPTIEAKRQTELNPQKTLDQFWKENHGTLPARFQILDKEKPTIILDTASNLDAFKNLLLGVRLLHYQRSLKGLNIVLGVNNASLDVTELLKQLRYFFKKTSGQVIVCPAEPHVGQRNAHSWDIEKIANDLKSMKIKAVACKTCKEAFDTATKTVDERHGLVVVTGSTEVVAEYWHDFKGMKKL